MNLILVAFGGSLGALARYASGHLFSMTTISTLVVNILGCFLSGALVYYFTKTPHEELSLLLIVGFLGSFTTYSTFNHQMIELLEKNFLMFAYYLCAQVLLGLGAFMIGRYLATFFINK